MHGSLSGVSDVFTSSGCGTYNIYKLLHHLVQSEHADIVSVQSHKQTVQCKQMGDLPLWCPAVIYTNTYVHRN